MTRLRCLIGMRPGPFALLLLAALVTRLVAPAGFMPALGADGFGIVICSGHAPAPAMAEMPGMHGMHEAAGHSSGSDGHGKSDMPCGFAGLAMPGLAGADPIQLALALLFIVAAALFVAERPVIGRNARLRPPSQGPPAFL